MLLVPKDVKIHLICSKLQQMNIKTTKEADKQ